MDDSSDAGAETRIEAPIRGVTVFRNGALVLRTGSSTAGRIRVGGLPLLYNSDSLRVRVRHGTVRDLEETCSLESRPSPPPPSETELSEIALEDRRLDDEIASVKALAELYGKTGPEGSAKEPPLEVPDARAWIALHDFAHQRLDALAARRRELELAKRELAERRARVSAASRGDREPPRFTRGVVFTIDGAEGECVFEVEYFVPAARWVPAYTLHLEGGEAVLAPPTPKGASLTLRALVAQATGEDWLGAELRFSTSDLSRETTLPELRSWRIGREQSPRRPAFRPLPTDLETLFAGYDTRASQRPSPKLAFPEPTPDKAAGIDLEDTAATFMDEPEEPVAAAAPPARRARRVTVQAAAASAGFVAPGTPEPTSKKRAEIAPPRPPEPIPPEPLPPRLRYAYLRLIGPARTQRGTIQAVAPLEHLWSLVEDHEAAHVADLHRAVDALRQAASRLARLPTPPGTTPLAGTSFHHVHAASGHHDVPSDGVFHQVLADRAEAPVAIEYRTVPRAGDDVFRFCRLSTPAGTPYPTGPLDVYEDGRFRVTGRLEATGGGKALELNLGVEPALRVTGRTADVEQQEKGVVSQKSRVTHRVRLRLRSALSDEARVVIYDRLPTPADNQKDLEVRLLESTPAAVEDGLGPDGKKLEGGLHWTLVLAPGETGEVTWSYEVSLPAGFEIVGGNRRE